MQVSAQLTTSDAATVAGAIVWAYQQLRGTSPPSKTSWLYPLALSSNETAHWTKMYNWNAGAVTTLGTSSDWFSNPLVTNGLKFSSYPDLGSGCKGMLSVLITNGGLAAADAGDQASFQTALNAYLGAGQTYPSLAGLISSLSSVEPAPYTPPIVIPPWASTALAVVSIGAAVSLITNAMVPGFLPKWTRV